MNRFANMSVAQLMAALSSPEPTPGGGTAAAIAGAMGASLLVMVTGLAKSRTNTDDEKTALAGARAAIEPAIARLTQLADEDTTAFNAVMAAFKLPKATDEEKAARSAAIQSALRGATDTPLQTVRVCVDALHHGGVVGEHGNRSAASDAGVAIGLLKAAADGAAANVRINLDSLKDESYKSATRQALEALIADAARHADQAMRALAV
jgi:formiminotetrahydrofolate cyclodeaminase